MVILKMRNGKRVMVDDNYMVLVNSKRIYMSDVYAVVRDGGKTIPLHRYIMKAVKGQEIDHINRNKLDNRLENLRFCTRSENRKNTSPSSANNYGHKGVHWHIGVKKWCAFIWHKNKNVHLGYFYCFKKAIEAREKAEVKYAVEMMEGK